MPKQTLCLSFGVLLLLSSASCQTGSERQLDASVVPDTAPEPVDVGQCARDRQNYSAEDVTAVLSAGLVSLEQFKTRYNTWHALVEYHKGNVATFAGLFPAGTIGLADPDALNFFEGTTVYGWPEAHLIPFMPLSAVVYDENELRFSKLTVNCGDVTVPGLRMHTKVNDLYVSYPEYLVDDLGYVSDLNARTMGFSHGRLIRELSVNAEPAEMYFYNGLRPWTEHPGSLLGASQFDAVIALNNTAHTVGTDYALSPHPNFAIAISDDRQTATLTAFLWQEAPADPDAGPDFVFQLVLDPV